MRRLILILSFLTSYFAVHEVQASHVMGSDIVYKCLGGGQYQVMVRVYRDCNGNNLNQADLVARCGATTVTVSTQTLVSVRDITGISPNCNVISACAGGPYAYGVEEYTFSMILNLSPYACCNWTLSWELCCRNNGISTGMAGQNFYTTATLNNCLATCNSSPDFTNPPIAIVCDDQDFIFNNGALDTIDVGDSLSYRMVPALQANATSVTYSGSYSATSPLRYLGFPNPALPWPSGFHLDAATGDLSFRPTLNGQIAVMVMEVTEWRNIGGIMTAIGTTRRDMQVIVTSCPGNNIPTISGPFSYTVCANRQICIPITTFDANATDTVRISWNNGLQGATFTNTNGTVRLATGSVCWTPTDDKVSSLPHTFTITARDNDCPLAGQAIASYSILVRESPHTVMDVQSPVCGDVIFRHVSTPLLGLATNWRVYNTSNALLWSSTQATDTNNFAPGTYYVQLQTSTVTPCDTTLYDTIVIPPSLDVNLPADVGICIGNNVLLQATAINAIGAKNYSWFTSGAPAPILSTDSFLLRTITVNRTYVVRVTDSLGCIASDTINVLAAAPPALNLGPNQIVCTGNSTTLDAGASGSTLSYLWSDASTGRLLIVDDSGTYSVRITDSLGCINNDTIAIALNSPEPIITGEDTVCRNKTHNYSVVPVVGETYAWNAVGGIIVGSSSSWQVDVLWNGTPSGTLSVTQTSAVGCDSSVSMPIIIERAPTPLITMTNDSACENNIATYRVNSFAGDTYSWSVSGGAVLGSNTDTAVNVLWGAPVAGSVTVIQTTATGCDSTVTQNIRVVATPKPVIVLPNDTACENKIRSYSITTPAAGHTYGWSVSGGNIIGSASGTSINVLWAGPGTATVSVNQTSPFGCDSAVTENVVIVQTPKPVIVLPNDSTCENKIATYSVTPVSGESYLWSVSGGAILGSVSASSIDVLWAAPGTGTVTLTQTSPFGCDSTVSANMIIVPTPKPVIGGDLNPCRDKLYTYTITTIDAVSYSWNIAGGTIQGTNTASSVTVIWDSLGLADISVLAISDFGCDSTVNQQILIRPVPRITVLGPDTICQNQVGTYQVQFDPTWSYNWSISNGQIIGSSNQNTLNVLWNQALTGTVTISVVNLSGCDTVIQNIPVFINPTPTPVIDGPGTVCRHEISQYSTSLPAGTTAEWAVSGGVILGNVTNDSIEVYWDSSTSNQIQLTFLNDVGCDSTVERSILVNPKPKPVILGDLVICENKHQTYVAQLNPGSDPGTHTYNWVTNGGTIVGPDTGLQIMVKWDMTGPGEISLIVQSAGACDSLVTSAVLVHPATAPEFDGADTVCEKEIATYTATPVLNNTYSWTVVNGIILGSNTSTSVIVIWGTQGTGELRLVQVNDNGCDSSLNKMIIIHERPKPQINGPVEVCEASEEIYSVQNIPSDSYFWEVAGGSIIGNASLSSVLIKWDQTGYGSLRLTQSNPFGCDSIVTLGVTINENPVAKIGGSSFACANMASNPYYIQDYGVDQPSYIQLEWTALGGQIISSTSSDTVRIDWGSSGSYPVILKAINQNTGCFSLDTFMVSVGVLQTPQIDIEDFTGCVPFTLTLNERNTTGNVEYTWHVLGKSPQLSNLPSPTFLFDDPDVYLIELIVKNEHGCVDTAYVSVNAAEQVFADFTFTSQDSVILVDDPVTFINQSVGANAYRWEFHNGDTTNTIDASRIYTEPGTYEVSLVAWNDAGCIDSIRKLITVRVRPELFIPNAFTPNGDGINDNFTVHTHYIAEFEMIIFDRWGEIIYTTTKADFEWDGTYKGQWVEEEVYGYYIQARDHYGKIIVRKGNITLMR